MNVILQDNLFRANNLLMHGELKCLGEYLVKTDSITILPEEVFEKTQRTYCSLIKKNVSRSNLTIKKLNYNLPNKRFHQPCIELDYENVGVEFLAYLKQMLKIQDNNFIDRENFDYPSAKGYQSLKDWSWENLKSFCERSKEKQLAIIGTESKECFNEIAKEANTLDYKIYYYESIKDFIAVHVVKIEFLTEDWLSENIDFEFIYDHIIYSENKRIRDSLFNIPDLKANYKSFSYIIEQIQPLNRKFTVHEMLDKRLIITISILSELNIEITTEKSKVSRFTPSIAKMKKCLYADIEVVVILKDKIIIDMEDIHYRVTDHNL